MSSPIRSLRLTFRYDDAGLRLVDRTPRRSPAPPTEQLDRDAPPGAIVLELRSARDEVRYRQSLVDPIPQSLEAGVGDGTFQRVNHARSSGGFSVVVPAPERGSVVVVSAGPAVVLAQPGLRAVSRPGRWRELCARERRLKTAMGVAHGTVIGTTKVVDHGPDEDKWCLLIAGDGFTSAEMSAFETVVADFVVFLESNLTGAVNWEKVNVIRLDVRSDESGADNPNCDDTIKVATYFDAEFCVSGLDRTLAIDESIAIDAANANFPEWDALLVFVNITNYGGLGGGGVAVASLDPVWSHEIALHEMGHAAFGLADEYPTWAGCASGETDRNVYDVAILGEPAEDNVTATLSPLKWADLVDPATPTPTTSNPDCTQCDTQASPVAAGTVGAFEGGRYYHCGIWRPEFNCRMNNLGIGFCAVCGSRIGSVLTCGITARRDTVLRRRGGVRRSVSSQRRRAASMAR